MNKTVFTTVSRREMLKLAMATGVVVSGHALIPGQKLAVAGEHKHDNSPLTGPSQGAVGFTSFIHPTVDINVDHLSLGAASIIDAFVQLNGKSAAVGNAVNIQDNCRLLNHSAANGRGNLYLGDGTFTAHGVTFVGNVHIGEACGTGINAIVQNARIGDASFTGLASQILGELPHQPIEIPESSLVLFGARIRSQDDVQANIMPVPAPFSLFFADVNEENLVLARGFNLLYRAASRMTPFSDGAGNPRNPGANFPDLLEAFGKLSVAPPIIFRRGTGVIPGRQASLGDLGFELFESLSPTPAPSTLPPDAGGIGLNAAPSHTPESGARFVIPTVQSPELIDDGAIVLGGCNLESGVRVGAGTYVLGDIAPTVFVGRNTVIGRNSSLHELTFTSCHVGENCQIGDRVVLHGPVEVGDNVIIGNGAILFGPKVHDGVKIGERALIFGPVEITEDVPNDAIIVAPGNEFLIAPSAPASIQTTAKQSHEMLAHWKHAQDSGHGCGCGVGNLIKMSA